MKNIIVVNKPKYISSNDAVQIIKKKFNYKKVGHAGTLDPLATGVLVLGVNDGTKQLSKLLLDNKQYIATIQFGYSTTTYDTEGEIVNKSTNKVDLEMINNWIQQLLNKQIINQTPPIYSALKVNGKRLYEYAVNNQHVEIKAREVKLFGATILDFDNDKQILTIKLDVSKGFYIRSFANDIGIALNTYATLIDLIRTKSGEFDLTNAIELSQEDIEKVKINYKRL